MSKDEKIMYFLGQLRGQIQMLAANSAQLSLKSTVQDSHHFHIPESASVHGTLHEQIVDLEQFFNKEMTTLITALSSPQEPKEQYSLNFPSSKSCVSFLF
jgi:hypothetical protein